jgi:hypothetical protein
MSLNARIAKNPLSTLLMHTIGLGRGTEEAPKMFSSWEKARREVYRPAAPRGARPAVQALQLHRSEAPELDL